MILRSKQWIILAALAAIAFTFQASATRAHFVWIETEPGDSGGIIVRSGFGEPGGWDPDLAEKIKQTVYKVQENGQERALDLAWDAKHDEYRARIVTGKPAALFGSCDYGVAGFGRGEPFELHYSAKCLVGTPDSWNDVKPSSDALVEILAKLDGEAVVLTALHKGEPMAGATIKCDTPVLKRVELTTDEQGIARWPVAGAGTYYCYVGTTLDQPGERDGKKYATKKHYGSLTFQLPDGAAAATSPVRE